MSAVFVILKFMGLLLLFLLAIFILIVLIVLLWPIQYSADISHISGVTAYKVRITWLLRLFSFYIEHTASSHMMNYRIAWKTKAGREKSEDEDERPPSEKDSSMKETREPGIEAHDTKNKREEEEAEAKDKTFQSDGPVLKHGKKNKINGMIQRFNKIKSSVSMGDLGEIIRAVKLLLKRLIRGIKPETFFLDCEFGFDSPDKTGMVLGAAAIIKALIDKGKYDMNIRGNFNEKALNLETALAGKLSLWTGLWPLILFCLTGPIWNMIYNTIFRKKNRKGVD